MTKAKTTLIQKDPEEGYAVSKYRPIACLPLMWKLLTSVLAEKVYTLLSEKNVLPDEQKGWRKNSRGTKYQLLNDKQILTPCKKYQRNLAKGWIDSKKVYDIVPHGWTTEVMKMVVEIADNIVNLLENSKETWRTELRACNESLEEVDIRTGIFRGTIYHLCFLLLFLYLY